MISVKIGFVSDSFPMGGLARVVSLVGLNLDMEGYESYFLGVNGDGDNFYQIPNNKLVVAEREHNYLDKYFTKGKIFIKLLLCKQSIDLGKYKSRELLSIKSFIEEKELDCLIICRYDLTFLVSRIKEIFPKLKIIVWIHGPVEMYTRKRERKKYLEYYIENLKFCNEVVCLTESDILELEKFQILGRKVYNPVEYAINNDMLPDTKEKILLCVSRLDIEDKGISKLISLANSVPDPWKVQLIGNGNSKETEELKKLQERLRNKNKFEFLGPKNSEELAFFYKNAEIYVSPAMYEGFGLTIAEAMCFALPVICFKTTGAKEITENGKFGILVEDFDESNFINEVLILIENEKKIKQFSELSLKRSLDFSLVKILETWKMILSRT